MFIYLEPVKIKESEARQIMDWRNNEDTLKMSFHPTPKKWPDFFQEFKEKYFPFEDCPPLFAYHRGQKVGFIRWNTYELNSLKGRVVDIGINFSPEQRGKGLSRWVLQKARDFAFSRNVDHIVAEIKKDNPISIRAFEGAGFRFLDEKTKKVESQNVPIYRCVASKPDLSYSKTSSPVFIIAEAGSNWRVGSPQRDMEMAKSLIDVAVESGADAVKFQTYKANTVYVQNAGQSDYLAESGIKKDISEIFEDLSMPYEMIPQLSEYCQKSGIEFMSTPFSLEDAQAIDPFVKRHKVASYEISHLRLIEYLAQTEKPIIMSTGAANVSDIEWSLNWFYQSGGKDITLLQCTAKYPAALNTLNLSVLNELRCRFEVPVGLSDHSLDPRVGPGGAVALGASVIEKHYTLDRRLPGPDHSFALEPQELKGMVSFIRQMEEARGEGLKIVQEAEQELKSFAQRSLQAIRPIKKGEALVEGQNFAILRSGQQNQGLHPRFLFEISGRKVKKDIQSGAGIEFEDLD